MDNPGNAAAMRKALEQSQQLLEDIGCGDAVFAQIAVNAAALAAPARNCDRFQSAAEAYATLGLECCDNLHFDCRRQYSCANCIALWLFAPAEGGAE